MYDVDPVDSLHQVPDELLPALAEGRALLVFGVLDRERRVALFDLVVF